MSLKEDDIILCTVKSIEGTTIFLDIEGEGVGSLVLSEIAAGRIRNIRDYVSPNKKIVCKILKIINGHPQLSLRRVTAKEKAAVMEKYQKEKTAQAIIKTVSKNSEKVIKEIKEKYDLSEFIDKAREDNKIINEFFSKEETPLLLKILTEKREKEKEAKKTIMLRTNSPSGLQEIKEALSALGKEIEIRYLGSSHFSIAAKGKDFKDANAKVDSAIAKIKERAHQKKLEFRAE